MNVLSNMTDEQLAMAYIGGNAAAFDLVLARNQQKIYSYILFVVHDRETAEDVFQDTFVKVVMRLQQGRYIPSGKFAAWVMRIAHNVIMDHYRDQHGEGLVDSAANSDAADCDSMDLAEGNVESRYVNEQVYTDVRHMMNMLPPVQREVIFMRFFQDFFRIFQIFFVEKDAVSAALYQIRRNSHQPAFYTMIGKLFLRINGLVKRGKYHHIIVHSFSPLSCWVIINFLSFVCKSARIRPFPHPIQPLTRGVPIPFFLYIR